ncbi:hypothetical protein [Guptibacillus algicola]|uniref:hypothetical protein n=1 Tax=Guptibacillus algicola TaxID=225844 RepID=UPI001CD373D3|nr:hypothetical protein [Alkalihalobacillus algicola]MCA0987863.1 hypothetical protein [Alkalihalobacillus algicola]
MERLYWKSRAIATLTNEERKHLSILLPYFGLSIEPNTKVITGALEHKLVNVHCSNDLFETLSKSLAHTGVRLKQRTDETCDLTITVSVRNGSSYPIALRVNNMNYYLKPLQMMTTNVQEQLHKRFWLPTISSSLAFRFQPYVPKHAAEWLSYAIIQSFHRDEFRPVDISFRDYQTIVRKVLLPLNKNFAQFQLQESETDWPDLPPELTTSTPSKPTMNKEDKKKPLIQEEPVLHHQIEPFKNAKANQQTQTFNPFKFQNRENRRSIINPFQKKR